MSTFLKKTEFLPVHVRRYQVTDYVLEKTASKFLLLNTIKINFLLSTCSQNSLAESSALYTCKKGPRQEEAASRKRKVQYHIFMHSFLKLLPKSDTSHFAPSVSPKIIWGQESPILLLAQNEDQKDLLKSNNDYCSTNLV